MYKILKKANLNEQVTLLEIDAPAVARKAEPGQFIMLRIDDFGERIPLTIADFDREKGTITIIFQIVGTTTKHLNDLNEGDFLLDFVGPLGVASHLDGYKKAVVIGGGLGTAIAYPQAKKLSLLGCCVTSIAGFRDKTLIILEDELKAVSDNTIIVTDDGSNGNKGFVTNALSNLVSKGEKFDVCIAIGPVPMMRAVANLTREFGLKTIVSLNSIMIDGTGMCGGCRVLVDGKTKFACVDGPDFDGHLVNFDDIIKRNSMYKKQEEHSCNLYSALT